MSAFNAARQLARAMSALIAACRKRPFRFPLQITTLLTADHTPKAVSAEMNECLMCASAQGRADCLLWVLRAPRCPPPYVASYWFGSAGTLGHEALLSDTHVFDFPVVGMIASAPTPDWSAE